jgi:hypothetical protein
MAAGSVLDAPSSARPNTATVGRPFTSEVQVAPLLVV